MAAPSDLLLAAPLPGRLMEALLFGLFAIHMLFVLFAVGTALLAVSHLIAARWGGRSEQAPWADGMLKTFMAHKSMAVVFGVGPLLLIQVGFTLPFFVALNLIAPAWILIIGLLIAAFLALDGLGQHPGLHAHLQVLVGLIGLALLLAVPGIFVAALITAEHSSQWLAIAANRYVLPRGLSWHWLLRYLHVIGAAVVFAGAFHYLASGRAASEKRRALYRWVVGGIVLQMLLGLPLYLLLPERPGVATNVAFGIGVIAVVAMLVVVLRQRSLDYRLVPSLLAATLLFMLLTRQANQHRGLLAPQLAGRQAAAAYRAELQPYRAAALAEYSGDLRAAREGSRTVYAQACAFCHGAAGKGDGVEAPGLAIAPQDLTAVRTTREHFNQTVLQGIPATAMPGFAFLGWDKVNSVTSDLDRRYHVLGQPKPVTAPVSPSALEQAQRIWLGSCLRCHGMNGTGDVETARTLAPPPPDFTTYTVTPERALHVITRGYPGTAMPSFAAYPEGVRWGLVRVVGGFYDPKGRGSAERR
jgi:mono/diheme cytochrome c family protein